MVNEMNNLEIERKFLVQDDSYKAQAIGHYTIRQGYISREAGHTVRVRMRVDSKGNEEAFLTIKSRPNENGFAHYEWERELSNDDAALLWKMCEEGIIEKTRWIVPADSPDCLPEGHRLVWEVDEFHSRHEGLVIAEIELEKETQAFIKPAFIGEEVTGQSRYQNSNL